MASLALLGAAAGWKIETSPRVAPRIAAVSRPAYAAPLAPGDAVQLDHLFLTPQHGAALPACQAMADRLGFAVPCPDLLPSDAIVSGPGCCIFQNPKVAPLFVLDSHFTAPTGYPSAEASSGPPSGHLVLTAEHLSGISSELGCQATTPIGPGPPIWGSPSYWERCPGPGANKGHLILEWVSAGISYSVSLHGETSENHAAVILIADQLTAVAPGDSVKGA